MKTIIIKNNTQTEQNWLRTFASGEEYSIPTDNALVFKYSNLNTLLTAIAAGDASIGDGEVFFSTVSEQINYLKGVDTSPRDIDNALVTRFKAAKAGWNYHMTGFELETSVLSSFYHTDVDGNTLNEGWVKYYDINNTELTTQGACDASCVKTVFTFEPTWDYEIIGGTMKTISAINSDIRVWIIGVPDVPAASGGSKVMVQHINLRFIDPNNGIVTDGRAAKYMTYNATYHTNKLQFTIKHGAGIKEKIMVAFELFRA